MAKTEPDSSRHRRRTKQALTKEYDVWLRQPYETNPAYEAFCVYRDSLPKHRALANIANKLDKSESMIRKWSSSWRWRVRAEAYDHHVDELFMQSLDKDRVAMQKRHMNIATNLQIAGSAKLQDLIEEIRESKQHNLPINMSTGEMLRFLELGMEMERYIRDAATAIVTDKEDSGFVLTIRPMLPVGSNPNPYPKSTPTDTSGM